MNAAAVRSGAPVFGTDDGEVKRALSAEDWLDATAETGARVVIVFRLGILATVLAEGLN